MDDNFSIASSGDPERDQAEMERYRLSQRRKREGICPNNCGPLFKKDAHTLICHSCGFSQHFNGLTVEQSGFIGCEHANTKLF